jgi:hypothetical protein
MTTRRQPMTPLRQRMWEEVCSTGLTLPTTSSYGTESVTSLSMEPPTPLTSHEESGTLVAQFLAVCSGPKTQS